MRTMKLQNLTTPASVCIVSLLVLTAPVSAQQNIGDLTTYTEVDGSGNINAPNPDELRLDIDDATFSTMYERQDIQTSGKSITMSFTLNITDDGGGDGSIGIAKDPVPTENTFGDIYGITLNGNEIYLDSPAINQMQFGTLTHGEEYDVTLEFKSGTSELNATVNGPGIDNTLTTFYPVAANHTIIAWLAQDDGTAGGEFLDGRITNYDVSLSDQSNSGEDLTGFEKVGASSTNQNTFNITQNWVSLQNFNENGPLHVRGEIDENEGLKAEYDLVIYGDNGNADGFTGIGNFTGDGQGNIVGYENTLDSSNVYVDYFNAQSMDTINEGELYHFEEYYFRHNGTARINIYEEDGSLFDTFTYAFPVAEPYKYFYAHASHLGGGGNTFYVNIGNVETRPMELQNSGPNLTTWYTNGIDSGLQVNENWVTYNAQENDGLYVLNESGPGTGDGVIEAVFYIENTGESDGNGYRYNIGWSDVNTSKTNDILGLTFAGNEVEINIFGSRTEFASVPSQEYLYADIEKNGNTLNISIYDNPTKSSLIASSEDTFTNNVNLQYTYAHGHTTTVGDDIGIGNIGIGTQAGYIPPEEPFTGNITLHVNSWMAHGSTQTYEVTVTGTSTDVTSETTVSSGNTTVITVSGNQLVATNDKSIAKRVIITADYDGQTDTANVTVANRTIDNIAIMPPEQFVPTVIGVDEEQASFGLGSEIQWILLAIMIGAMATHIAKNEWLGIGIITGLIILFWVISAVSLGMVFVSVVYALFAGYMLRETPSRSDTNVGGFNQ